MDGYGDASYGDGFADVYDDWYHSVSDVDATVADLLELAAGGHVLELGVGTGRLAVPLARAGGAGGTPVTGVDTSAAMLARLAARDPDGVVTAVRADMVDGLPDGPFTLAFVAYNTLFNLTTDERQRACFAEVYTRLTPGGRFVIEAFVPDDPPRHGDHVGVRSMTADRVVLAISVHDAAGQTAEGQFVELADGRPVRLRPWSIRYATPQQLDAMARDQGFVLEHRWAGFGRVPFDDDADRHVSVYRKM